jgi:hypothetical protein
VNADLSVAPEIAQLAMPLMPATWEGTATTGQLATGLARLAAAPQRWWDLVRFNPDGPALVAVPAPFEAWLLVLPPGHSADCHCELATLVAGEASAGGPSKDGAGPGKAALRQGRVRVHGTGRAHAHGSTGHGYSVSLHAGRAGAVRSV